MLIVAALAWLYSLTQQINEQTDALNKLAKAVDHTDSVQTVALETLLAKTDDGRSPKKFIENFEKSSKELEQVKYLAKDKEKLTNLAMEANRKLEEDLDKLKKDMLKAQEKIKKEEDAYTSEHEKYNEAKSELETFYKTPTGEMARKYSTSLYAAIAGWIVAILASLGLLAMWMTRMPPEDAMDPRTGPLTIPVTGVSPNPPPAQEPPHQIV